MIPTLTRRRSGPPTKWLWHRKFIIWRIVSFEGETGLFGLRFETVLRRWSPMRRGWIYARPTDANARLIGTALSVRRKGD